MIVRVTVQDMENSNERLATGVIQRAVDACFLAGGGTVEVEAGEYRMSSVRLRSHVTLYLKSGARLIGTRDPKDYYTIEKDTIEPLEAAEISDVLWIPLDERTPEDRYSWINTIGSSWNHALIRAVRAEDIAVIGEAGSVIDGADCYDPAGEERYRGPHGINIHESRGITLRGYTIQNTGNWAHCIYNSTDITVEQVTVYGGHDGVDVLGCHRAVIRNCAFYTGDDCVAGYALSDLEVADCIMNTACSAFRLGGTRVRIHDCRLFGPAKYLFRGSLTTEEKMSGKPRLNDDGSEGGNHRYNMLSAFTYFAADGLEIEEEPGDIEIRDCVFENIDRFVHYNFSGNEPWQQGRALHDVAFRHIRAAGIRLPLTLYGEAEHPVQAVFEDVELTLSPDFAEEALIRTGFYEKITLKNCRIENAPVHLMKRWGTHGEFVREDLVSDHTGEDTMDAAEVFECPWI